MSNKFELIDSKYQGLLSAWRAKGISNRQDLERALADYAVRFSYNSGRIENTLITYHDTREVFEHGRAISFSGDVRTLFEIQNLKASHEQILESFEVRASINEELILSFHKTLTHGTYDEARWANGERPGEYKKRDYVVGADDIGAPAENVAQEVRALCKEMKEASPENIFTSAAYFHLVFESIHPFADGNGRCGRALMNYLLVLNGHPPVIVFDDDKMSYYGMFRAWDTEGNLAPALEFLKVEVIKTWDGLL